MKTPIQDFIENSERIFQENVVYPDGVVKFGTLEDIEELKSFHTSQLSKLLELVGEEIESEREYWWTSADNSENLEEKLNQIGKDGYNQALDSLKSKLGLK